MELAEGLKSSIDSSRGSATEFLLDRIRILFLGVVLLRFLRFGRNCSVLFDHIADPSVSFEDVTL